MMPNRQSRRLQAPRRPLGFTLVETLVAMTMVVLIMSVATRFFMQQTRMLSHQSGRLEAQQNAQFSLATLDREMRVAGIGVVDKVTPAGELIARLSREYAAARARLSL